MQLTDMEQTFLAKRAWFVRTWRYVGAMLLAMVLALGGWLVWTKPLLANPVFVWAQLRSGVLPETTLVLMAGLLPLLVLLCLILASGVVLLAYAAFASEKKYLKIIQRLSARS